MDEALSINDEISRRSQASFSQAQGTLCYGEPVEILCQGKWDAKLHTSRLTPTNWESARFRVVFVMTALVSASKEIAKGPYYSSNLLQNGFRFLRIFPRVYLHGYWKKHACT